MTDTFIELTEEAFDAQYSLRTNHINPHPGWAYGENGGCLFETYGEELAFVRSQDPRTVWTLTDGDDGDQYLLSGFHLVNRIAYLISTSPVPEGTTIQVHIPMQPEQAAEATAHTPEPWKHYPSRLVDSSLWKAQVQPPESEPCSPCAGYGITKEESEANARRICAAVNACKGISTEALERGMIAKLRHLLGELVSAAGDLDAAIDGATDKFDAERGKLTPVLRAGQAVLDGAELDLHELLAARGQIALGWSIEDVQEVRPDLTGDQAWEVLQEAERKHDAMMGISWDTLEILADELFGPAPETATEEE